MLFRNDEASLKLEILRYEFPEGEGRPDSDDGNWLVLRGTYTTADGRVIVDSQACLLTYELRELTAGLKVLGAGVKDEYESGFVETPFFSVFAQSDGANAFTLDVSFALTNTMEDEDTAEVECTLTKPELRALIDELDELCAKFPDRR